MSIIEHLEQLLEYGLERKLISIWDREYTRNRLYEALDIKHPEPVSHTCIKQAQSLPDLLLLFTNGLRKPAGWKRIQTHTVTCSAQS